MARAIAASAKIRRNQHDNGHGLANVACWGVADLPRTWLDKLVTLMRTMRLADNSHHRFKRWFDKEV